MMCRSVWRMPLGLVKAVTVCASAVTVVMAAIELIAIVDRRRQRSGAAVGRQATKVSECKYSVRSACRSFLHRPATRVFHETTGEESPHIGLRICGIDAIGCGHVIEYTEFSDPGAEDLLDSSKGIRFSGSATVNNCTSLLY